MVIQPVSGNGGIVPSGTIQITENGTHNVAVYANAEVNVPTSQAVLITKNITENGTYNASSDSADGYSSVTVNVSGETPTGTLSVTENGLYNCSTYANVDVQVPEPSGTIQITENGVVDVKDYASANVSVSSPNVLFGIPATSWAYLQENNGYLTSASLAGTLDFSSVIYINEENVLKGRFNYMNGIVGVADFHNCVSINGNGALWNCFKNSGVSGLNFSGLQEINANSAFLSSCDDCSDLTLLDFSSLEEVHGDSVFASVASSCTSLTTVKFDSLEEIDSQTCFQAAFAGCTSLTSLQFPALSIANSYAIFNNMLSRCTGVTVRFPIAMQATLEQDPDVQVGFGGTNTTVLFDIVTSLTGADTNTYTRSQKNSTATATAWLNNSTLYYTSGTSEPSVSDTIYSDAACTITVTTVSAIA